MSADPVALQALAVRAKTQLRYFELVNFSAAEHNVKCFMAVGKHALYLIRRNLGGLYPTEEGGKIFFAFIRSMVEDEDNATDLLLLLSESGALAWKSEKLFVSCDNRHALAQRIQVAWNTDYVFRFGQVRHLHLTKQSLRGERGESKQTISLTVKPFNGCKQVLHHGYRFFVPQSYKDQDHGGHFLDERQLALEIKVQEPVAIVDLEAADQNHIRWSALEYKESLTLPLSRVVITSSCGYHKRMNLMNDICAWSGWELALRSEESVMAVILLRRQYVPPLADSAQDFIIRVTSPRWAVDEGQVEEALLLHEARWIADCTMPDTPNCTVPQQMYRDFIQAKLDTLLLPESALAWTEQSLGMKPSCEREARVFLKACMKVLKEEYQLSCPSLLDEVGEDIPLLVSPLEAAQQTARSMPGGEESGTSGDFDEARNAWWARVARYFTYCLDGVIFRNFSLADVCDAVLTAKPNRAKIHEALLFMLHVRPQDMTQKWQPHEIKHLLLHPEFFQTYEFNDRAMQALLEFGWLAKQLKPPKGDERMSLEFSEFLAVLLVSSMSSIDLKAAICREIISACSGPMHVAVLVPALSAALQQRNIHLKTHATVTLVNMTANHELVKDILIKMEAPQIIARHLCVRDNDLLYYTLMLTTNLTRSTAHRQALNSFGVVGELTQLLQMPLTPSKHQILAEVACTLGQLCSEKEIWESFSDGKVLQRLIQLHMSSPPGSRLRSKMMFALRQICYGGSLKASDFREEIGPSLPAIIQELHGIVEHHGFDAPDSEQTDCVVNAVLLLHTLSISPNLAQEMRELGFNHILMKLRFSPLSKLDATRERLVGLWDLMNG
ncbi:unnamed protein product [Effrenium voratum]|nr:unnamed protein product [Effrenium voratum]